MYVKLFAAGKSGSLELANRIVMTAMGTDMGELNGNPSDLTISYFSKRAKGGAGLIITVITRVNNIHGVATPRQLSMANDSNIIGMKKLTDKIHETDTKIFCQLHHPGRQNYSALIYVWPMMVLLEKIVPGFSKIFAPLVAFYKKLIAVTFAPAVMAPSAVPYEYVR